MDDFVVRPRYPRSTIPSKRRKSNYRNENKLAELILRQTLASILLLIAIVGVKNFNTPSTNMITTKIQEVLFQSVDIKSVYKDVDSFISGLLTGSKNSEGLKAENLDPDFNEPSVPVSANAENANEVNLDITLLLPVKNGILSSAFGERIDPFTNEPKNHEGIDIKAQKGEEVKAALTGTVEATGTSSTYGNYVRVAHDGGLLTLYAHCSQILVKKGQEVMQGGTIARVGNTGASVGAHLHFELWKDGIALDPLKYMEVPSQ